MRSDVVATSTSYVRRLNQTSIFHHIYDAKAMSVARLVELTGLSKPTVRATIADLEDAGLLSELGTRTGAAGRAPMIYGPNPDVGWIAVIDVGRVRLNVVLADLTGLIRESRTADSSGSAASLIPQIATLLDEMTAAHGRDKRHLLTVVVGGPGIFDLADKSVRLASNLEGWEGPAVVDAFRGALGDEVDLVFENDVNLGALGETMSAPGRDAHSFVYLHVGTGLGTGIVVDGALHRGAHGAAGEAAFLAIPHQGGYPLADRERHRGKFETEAAASALVANARAQGYDGPESAEAVLAAAGSGDQTALRAVEIEIETLAYGLASIVALLDPELVILGGGVGRNLGDYLDDIDLALAALLPLPRPEIVVSRLGDDAIVHGGIQVAVAAGRDALLMRALA